MIAWPCLWDIPCLKAFEDVNVVRHGKYVSRSQGLQDTKTCPCLIPCSALGSSNVCLKMSQDILIYRNVLRRLVAVLKTSVDDTLMAGCVSNKYREQRGLQKNDQVIHDPLTTLLIQSGVRLYEECRGGGQNCPVLCNHYWPNITAFFFFFHWVALCVWYILFFIIKHLLFLFQFAVNIVLK